MHRKWSISHERKSDTEALAGVLSNEIEAITRFASQNQTCKRKAVGCSAVKIIAPAVISRLGVSQNGPTFRHGKDWCNGIKGACGCPHAEPKLMLSVESEGLSTMKSSVICCSYSPCTNCANIILSSRHKFDRLVYGQFTEHDPRGLEILHSSGFQTISSEVLFNIMNRTYTSVDNIVQANYGQNYDTLDLWLPS